MDIQAWASDLLAQVKSKWESSQGKYDFWESGFQVFYSPVRLNPEVMFIGYNPGGGKDALNIERDSRIPTEHEYLVQPYKLAIRMRELFKDIDKSEWLANSVKLNLIFFRSIDDEQWRSISLPLRKELERFCFEKVKDIVEVVKPRFIVAEGIKTFTLLTGSVLPGCSEPELTAGSGKRAIYARNSWNNTKIAGLMHPSGARISKDDWKKMAVLLGSDLVRN